MAQEEDDTLQATGALGPTPEEFPGRRLPAIYSNQFYVVVGPVNTRVVFGEQIFVDTAPQFHAAFSLPNEMAKDMAEAILRLIEQERVKAVLD